MVVVETWAVEVDVAVVDKPLAEDGQRESVVVDTDGETNARRFPFPSVDSTGDSSCGSGDELVLGVGEAGGRLMEPADGDR